MYLILILKTILCNNYLLNEPSNIILIIELFQINKINNKSLFFRVQFIKLYTLFFSIVPNMYT